jgi:hypothetical protein
MDPYAIVNPELSDSTMALKTLSRMMLARVNRGISTWKKQVWACQQQKKPKNQ